MSDERRAFSRRSPLIAHRGRVPTVFVDGARADRAVDVVRRLELDVAELQEKREQTHDARSFVRREAERAHRRLRRERETGR